SSSCEFLYLPSYSYPVLSDRTLASGSHKLSRRFASTTSCALLPYSSEQLARTTSESVLSVPRVKTWNLLVLPLPSVQSSPRAKLTSTGQPSPKLIAFFVIPSGMPASVGSAVRCAPAVFSTAIRAGPASLSSVRICRTEHPLRKTITANVPMAAASLFGAGESVESWNAAEALADVRLRDGGEVTAGPSDCACSGAASPCPAAAGGSVEPAARAGTNRCSAGCRRAAGRNAAVPADCRQVPGPPQEPADRSSAVPVGRSSGARAGFSRVADRRPALRPIRHCPVPRGPVRHSPARAPARPWAV